MARLGEVGQRAPLTFSQMFLLQKMHGRRKGIQGQHTVQQITKSLGKSTTNVAETIRQTT